MLSLLPPDLWLWTNQGFQVLVFSLLKCWEWHQPRRGSRGSWTDWSEFPWAPDTSATRLSSSIQEGTGKSKSRPTGISGWGKLEHTGIICLSSFHIQWRHSNPQGHVLQHHRAIHLSPRALPCASHEITQEVRTTLFMFSFGYLLSISDATKYEVVDQPCSLNTMKLHSGEETSLYSVSDEKKTHGSPERPFCHPHASWVYFFFFIGVELILS